MTQSEVAAAADYSIIRYAQCWEDADNLLRALDIRPGEVCFSVASAGDNTLSMLTRDPDKVIVVDLSPAQMACLEIRIAAYRELSHGELLELMGASASDRRPALYARLRGRLSPDARAIWDSRPTAIRCGIGAAGKFENYIRIFRRFVLPLIHGRERVDALFRPRSPAERGRFYAEAWDNWRWRLLVKLFCSRAVAARLGRDPRFFRYVEGGVADRVLASAEHALTELDPRQNPYLQWIAFGRHTTALPHALRAENFDAIRTNLHRLETHVTSAERYFGASHDNVIDRFNMSDVFEYVSEQNTTRALEQIARLGRSGGRVAYWNTFVPRSRPEALADRLRPLSDLAERLHRTDKTFFYDAFVVEEII